jgi:transposase-like protein
MVGHGAKFGRKKEQAIAALLSNRNIEQAARAVGIGVTTLRRWMRNPQFKAEYLEARREGLAQATARLQQSSGPAASTLLKLMVDTSMPPAIRLRAADYVLKHGLKSLEDDDLEARLAQLENAEKTRGNL